MKKNLLLTLTLSLLAISCSQKSGITGTFSGLTNDTLRIQVSVLSDVPSFEYQRTDTIIVRNGKFFYAPLTDNLTQLRIIPIENANDYLGTAILLYSPNDRIRLNANNNNGVVAFTASGNRYNEQLSTVNANRQRENAREKKLNFIRQNLDEPLSAFLLSHLQTNEMPQYSEKLEGKARESVFGQMLEQRVESLNMFLLPMKTEMARRNEMRSHMIGVLAPDFTLKDINGNNFTLSSLRGQYVVLNFWGSWCGACFIAFPYIIAYYKAHPNEFSIVSVAFNDTEERWRNAVGRAGLPWINVLDKDNSVSAKFRAQEAPMYVLIDKEGVVVSFSSFLQNHNEVFRQLDELREKGLL